MKRNVYAYFLIMIFAVTTVLAGCANSHDEKNLKAKNPVKLSFIYQWTGTDTKAPFYEPQLEKFKTEHPEIELELVPIAGGEFQKQFLVKLASNSLSDVFSYYNGARAGVLFESNAVKDITDFVKNDPDIKDRFYPLGFNGAIKDEKIYGVPAETIYLETFVNRELFKKYNLEYPKTFDELKHVIKVFRDNGIVPITASAKGREFTPILDMLLLNLMDTKDFLASISGKSDIHPSFEKAAQYIKELNDLKAFPDSMMVMPIEQPVEMFNSGQAAMLVNGNYYIGSFTKETMQKTDVIPFPQLPESKPEARDRIIEFSSNSYFINSNLKDPEKLEAAKTFIKYMTRDDFAIKVLTEQAGAATPNKAPFDKSKVNPVLNQIFELKAKSKDSRARIIAELSPAAADTLQNTLQGLLIGKFTPKDFYNELNQGFKSK